MKKFLLLSAFILVGCENQCRDRSSEQFSEMNYVPKGAKFIKSYEPNSSMLWNRDRWMKWELDGECFLSYDVRGQAGLLTKVSCPEGAE